MSEKVAVVTGANKGIGFAIVRGLCKRFEGAVYLTSRNVELGEKAVADLEKEGLHPKYHQLDITEPISVKKFQGYIKERYGGIDILINNAAIAFKKDAEEPVAIQAKQTLFVNYFSLVLTCDILFPLLRNGGRVVNVSSAAGHLTFIPSNDLRNKLKDPKLSIEALGALMRDYVEAAKNGTHADEWGNSSYVVSKVGMCALTLVHQRMLDCRDIKVNSCHPGYVDTDMSSHKGHMTIDQGAVAPLFLALEADDDVRGQYVWHDKSIIAWDGIIPSMF